MDLVCSIIPQLLLGSIDLCYPGGMLQLLDFAKPTERKWMRNQWIWIDFLSHVTLSHDPKVSQYPKVEALNAHHCANEYWNLTAMAVLSQFD
jgi:hypothetical protein